MTSTTLEPSDVAVVTDADAPPDGPVRRRWLRRPGPNLAVFGIYAVISLIADLPVWPGDPSRVPTMLGEDIFQTAWFLEWTPYALLHGKNLFETNAINYPVGVNLAQNTGIPLLGLVTAPLTLAVNPIASENLLRFFGFALSAYAAYWVLRKFTTWIPAAFVGGAPLRVLAVHAHPGEHPPQLDVRPLPAAHPLRAVRAVRDPEFESGPARAAHRGLCRRAVLHLGRGAGDDVDRRRHRHLLPLLLLHRTRVRPRLLQRGHRPRRSPAVVLGVPSPRTRRG